MKKLLLVFVSLVLAACGSFKTVTQTEEGSFLQLVGSTKNAVLQLNDVRMDLNDTRSFDLNGKEVTKIAVPAGQHRVTITRAGSLLVDRKIFIGEGNAFEITLP